MPEIPSSIASFTRESLAEAWGCSTRSIDRLIASGDLKSYRIGRRGVRVTQASASAYIQKQEALIESAGDA